MIKRYKKWQEWRSYNGNSKIYQLLVLFGYPSPSFRHHVSWEELREAFIKGMREAVPNDAPMVELGMTAFDGAGKHIIMPKHHGRSQVERQLAFYRAVFDCDEEE